MVRGRFAPEMLSPREDRIHVQNAPLKRKSNKHPQCAKCHKAPGAAPATHGGFSEFVRGPRVSGANGPLAEHISHSVRGHGKEDPSMCCFVDRVRRFPRGGHCLSSRGIATLAPAELWPNLPGLGAHVSDPALEGPDRGGPRRRTQKQAQLAAMMRRHREMREEGEALRECLEVGGVFGASSGGVE